MGAGSNPAGRTLRPALALAALLAFGAGQAWAGPGITFTVGRTGAILGEVDEGGMSLSLAALWALQFHGLETGVVASADDFGSTLQILTDPTTGAPAGSSEFLHRASFAIAYRLDARPFPSLRWEPFASGTWGLYRVRDDRLGDTLQEASSLGFSLAAGLRRALPGTNSVGAEVRYHRLFNDVAGRYASAALEWRWR